ncbi:hypothetical protein J437_LFUL006939 [Ladona fulva]|uniref:PiggyBac transposable element-derived protein domain-containing protein n=1 Tax=Ladona fulva TaxID=123851 RepID=A0A8K0K5Z4_LADFU|nr:hypothetical protein J437_LFUL006939 [Ladona fulva]
MCVQPGPSRVLRLDAPDFKEQVMQYLREDDSEVENSDENEEDDSDEEESVSVKLFTIKDRYYFGKNRYKWSSKEPKRNVRTRLHSIVVEKPGLKQAVITLGKEHQPIHFWSLIFDYEMIHLILRWTNVKLQNLRLKYNRSSRPEIQDLDSVELRALLGLLIRSSVFKSNDEDINSNFATDGTGREIFGLVTSGQRFAVLLLCLRFDNHEDRMARYETDPVAPISDLFNCFIKYSQRCYSLGTTTCIDEMLIAFMGRCCFKMYIPSKPAKYGLKMMCLTDASNSYLYNAYLYAGKDTDGIGLSEEDKKTSKPTQSVLRLSMPIINSHRNITSDNWFTSTELSEKLRVDGLTYVGTGIEIKPNEFGPKKGRAIGSSLHGFTANMTLVSHVPKRNRAVCLVSLMHHRESSDNLTGKPEIIGLCNYIMAVFLGFWTFHWYHWKKQRKSKEDLIRERFADSALHRRNENPLSFAANAGNQRRSTPKKELTTDLRGGCQSRGHPPSIRVHRAVGWGNNGESSNGAASLCARAAGVTFRSVKTPSEHLTVPYLTEIRSFVEEVEGRQNGQLDPQFLSSSSPPPTAFRDGSQMDLDVADIPGHRGIQHFRSIG